MGRRNEDEWNDSEEDVLDNWEEELEEKPAVVAPPIVQKPKQIKKKEEAPVEVPIYESEAERKRRTELAVKRSDLQNTMDLFGVDGAEVDLEGALREEAALLQLDDKSVSSRPQQQPVQIGILESSEPSSIPEFEKYADAISAFLTKKFAGNKNFLPFLETLFRRLLQTRDITELRKMSTLMQDLITLKQKEQQRAPVNAVKSSAPAPAATASTKKKPSLLLGAKKGNDIDMTNYDDDDYDDDY